MRERVQVSEVDRGLALAVESLGEPQAAVAVAVRGRPAREDHARLFENMLEGAAHIRNVRDPAGRVVDWVYLEVNPAFERLIGLHDVVGKMASEVPLQAAEDLHGLLERFQEVTEGRGHQEFELFLHALSRRFRVSAFSPAPDEIIALFDDITARRRAEQDAQLFSSAIENASVPMMIWMPRLGLAA